MVRFNNIMHTCFIRNYLILNLKDLISTTLVATFEIDKENIPQTLLNLDSFFSLISNEANKVSNFVDAISIII